MPQRPADRYGDRPFDRRWLIPIIVIAVVLAGLGGLAMLRIADQGVQWGMITFDTSGQDEATARIEVTRSPDTAVTCELEAVDARQIIVGQTAVDVPTGGDRTVVLDVEIPLQGDAAAVKIVTCRRQ
ncbi:MAG TPA: DUF4307 domain-containing protein [Jiangellaceae bacterium]